MTAFAERQGPDEHRIRGNAQGRGEHPADADRMAAQPDEISPRKPGDPPWRSRTAHRSCDPRVARLLFLWRLRRGWTVAEAARQTGVSRRMIYLLEAAKRRPSEPLAEALVDGYGMEGPSADAVRSIALPDVGRDSPYRTDTAAPGRPDAL